MDSIFDEEQPRLSDLELFSKIWTEPKKAFRYLDDYKYDRFTSFLLIFAGLMASWKSFFVDLLDHSGYWMDKIPEMLGVIAGVYFLSYIYAALISLSGRWLQANSNYKSLLRVIVYARIPYILGSFMALMIQSYNVITETEPAYGYTPVYQAMAVSILVSALWSAILLVIGTMEVQKLPAGKAILNLLIPALIMAIPLSLIYLAMR